MKDEPVFEYHAEEARIDIELPDSNTKEITIKSGWSFGTGGHETTRLCLRALEEQFKHEGIITVLDIGCGSGILSIASAALGAKDVNGVDIDSSIIEEARVNSKNNGTDDRTSFSSLPLSDITGKYNLITANILLKTVLNLLPKITQLADDNANFIASGIRNNEKNEALGKFESSGFTFVKSYEENDWIALLLKKTG